MDDADELMAWLKELQERPEPQAPWGLRWMDKISTPTNPWLLRAMTLSAAVCYVLGFIFDQMWFIACYSLLFLAYPIWEARSKLRREARLAQYRADMREMEATYLRVWKAMRLEAAITPDWMQ